VLSDSKNPNTKRGFMTTTTATATAAPKVSAEPTREELLARIAQLERKAEFKGEVIKVTEKGSLSMYGLGHYPVTLTFTQWLKVAKQLPALMACASLHYGKLFFKSDEQSDAAAEALKSVK
jgi:hypothetical protein